MNEEDNVQRDEMENLDRQENINLQIEEAMSNPTNPESMPDITKETPISKNVPNQREKVPETSGKQ